MKKARSAKSKSNLTAEKRKKASTPKTPKKSTKDVKDDQIDAITFKAGTKFNDDFIIVEKIGKGAYGQVYSCKNAKNAKETVALKAEAHVEKAGCAIKIERQVLNIIQSRSYADHIAMCYNAAKRKNFSYMIMTLMGKSLKDVQKGMGGKKNFHLSTWIRIGIQALYGLKTLHDNGFVHRDVKPANFALGVGTDQEKATIVHVLDFGLSRNYCYPIDDEEQMPNDEVAAGVPTRWQCRVVRPRVRLRGTARYCSPNAHDHVEQGRRDDIWSLMYMLIDFHCGLPWSGSFEVVKKMKDSFKDSALMINMPEELADILPGLRKLDCYARPDYRFIYKRFLAVMQRNVIQLEDRYDWEPKNKKLVRPRLLPEWYDAEDFFLDDPIGDLDPSRGKKEDDNVKSLYNLPGGSIEAI